MESEIFGLWLCMTAYCLLAGIGLCGGGEILSALGPFHFHVSPRCWRCFFLVVGVWFVFSIWLFACVVVSWFSLVHHMLRHT